MRITLKDIFNIPTAVIYEPDKFKAAGSVSIDSRRCKRSSIFVAIKGNNFDGHDFVKNAVANGANAVVINKKKLNLFDDLEIPIIAVNNTLKAYGYLASVWRNKLKAKVISITGSNGKTTTKEILAALLNYKYNVVSSRANFNNHIGVPLTVFSANDKTEFLILEHGTNHFGEIKYTADIAKPDFALITNVGDSHLEYFGDRNGVLKEKLDLFLAAQKQKGWLFFNYNDSLLRKASQAFGKTFSFGRRGNANLIVKIIDYDERAFPTVNIEYGRTSIKVKLNLLGEMNVENYAAAVSVAIKIGLKKKEIIEATENIKAVKGRLNLIELKDTVIIDDTYNSNPASVEAALKVLKKIKLYKRSLIILGDMFELGKETENLHLKIVEELKKVKNSEVLTLGKHSAVISKSLNNGRHFRRRIDLKNHLLKTDIRGCKVLVKGSRGMRMEEFVEIIKGK